MPHLLEEEEIFVLTFDLRYKESRKSFNARAAMIQFEGPIAFRRLMITGKEKLSRVFLLYLCLQNTEFVEQIKDSKKMDPKLHWHTNLILIKSNCGTRSLNGHSLLTAG